LTNAITFAKSIALSYGEWFIYSSLIYDTTIDRKMTLMLHAKRCLDAVFDK
jgi:hypothetical protein